MLCIYCGREGREPSAEHVVADALGGSITLHATDVCKGCNGEIDRTIDRSIQTDLTPILSQLGIPGKRGTTAPWVVEEEVAGEDRRFLVQKGQVVAAEPRKLLTHIGDAYEFRARSPALLEEARANIARRHPGRDVQLSPVVEREVFLPPQRIDYLDFSAPHWLGWAAKTCVNTVCYFLGGAIVTLPEFADLRAIAMDCKRDGPSDLGFGGIGDNVAEVTSLPARHRLLLDVAEDRITVQVTLFDYCGFSLVRRISGFAPTQRYVELDAAEKRVLFETVSGAAA
jgi:hypothetical protein